MSTGATTEFSYSGTELDALTEARNYYSWLLHRFSPHLGRRVIEVGAGIGTFSEFLLRAEGVSELTLLEPAENTYPRLHERFLGNPRVRTLRGYLEDHAGDLSGDSLVSVNVLEHVPDDEAFLRDAHRALVPGGKVLLFVPALGQIYGTLDEAFEHYRRYTRGMLASRLERAGFRPLRVSYMNLPGIFSWLVAGKLLRKRTLSPADVRLYDSWVIPWVRRLEDRWEAPVGQSLLAIAQKDEHKHG